MGKLISIGLPVRNGMPFVQQALHSLLAQTYADLDIFIADNASTDQTAAVCRKAAESDKRLRFHHHEHDIGMMANLNFVLRAATGKFFMWAAYDDLRAPDAVHILYKRLFAHPALVAAHSWVSYIRPDGTEIGWDRCLAAEASSGSQAARRNAIAEACELGCFWETAIYGLIRREVAVSLPPLSENPGADTEFVRKLIDAGPVHIEPKRLISYRVFEGKRYVSNGRELALGRPRFGAQAKSS